jgi:gas vesicle protein
MSENNNSGEVILAFILGGIIGAVAGILYAPRSGKETREKLVGMGEDLAEKFEGVTDEVKNKAKHFVSEGKEKINSQKERLEEAFEAGKKAYEKQ